MPTTTAFSAATMYSPFRDEYDEMLKQLGLKPGEIWNAKMKPLVAKLLEFEDAALIDWIVLTTATKWECQGEAADELGKALGLEIVTDWQADDAFWDGIKSKDTLLAIAKENGISKDMINKNKTSVVIRGVLKSKVKDDWRPKWLKF